MPTGAQVVVPTETLARVWAGMGAVLVRVGGIRLLRVRRHGRPGPGRYGARVVDLDEVARLASGLPEVTEGERHGHLTWSVAGKAFAWERPFSKADIRRYGDAQPPDGPRSEERRVGKACMDRQA